MRRNEIPNVANSVIRVRILMEDLGSLNANDIMRMNPPHMRGNKTIGNSGAPGIWAYPDTRIPLLANPLITARATWLRPRDMRPMPVKNKTIND